MRTFKKHIILNEDTYDIGADVDYIFSKFIEPNINRMIRKEISIFDIKPVTFSSAELPSKQAQEAHALMPVMITVSARKRHETSFGTYHPINKTIDVKIPEEIFGGYAVSNHNSIGDLLKEYDPSMRKKIYSQINGSNIKATTSHELSHWIDDALHNRLTHNIEQGWDHGYDTPKAAKYRKMIKDPTSREEVQAQIHTIKQMKRDYERTWDTMTFNDMLKLNKSLSGLFNYIIFNDHMYDVRSWVKDIITRMNREGLLGKNMHNIEYKEIK